MPIASIAGQLNYECRTLFSIELPDRVATMDNDAFQFTVEWADGQQIRIQACTDLKNPHWEILGTQTMTSGSCLISDTNWISYTQRFYRIVSSD